MMDQRLRELERHLQHEGKDLKWWALRVLSGHHDQEYVVNEAQAALELSTCHAVVTATDQEVGDLWAKWADDVILLFKDRVTRKRVLWKQSTSWGVQVGQVNDMPVAISVSIVMLDDRKFAFVDATSMLVDWNMVDAWIRKNAPRARRSDATNFGNLMRR